jgi:hypothetical protein
MLVLLEHFDFLQVRVNGHLDQRRVMRASNLVGDDIEALRQLGDSVAAR